MVELFPCRLIVTNFENRLTGSTVLYATDRVRGPGVKEQQVDIFHLLSSYGLQTRDAEPLLTLPFPRTRLDKDVPYTCNVESWDAVIERRGVNVSVREIIQNFPHSKNLSARLGSPSTDSIQLARYSSAYHHASDFIASSPNVPALWSTSSQHERARLVVIS